jgi:hypothetical protein
MAEPRLVLRAGMAAADALAALRDLGLSGAPVVDRDGAFIGSIQTPRLAQLAGDGADQPVGRLADVEAMTVPVDATLDAAVDAVATSRGGWIPVLDVGMHVVGIVSTTDVVRGWRLATRTAMRRLGGGSRETGLIEETIAAGSASDGARVDQLAWPRGAVLVAVHRRNGLAYPHPDTELHHGDVVSVLARREDEASVRAIFTGATETERPTSYSAKPAPPVSASTDRERSTT